MNPTALAAQVLPGGQVNQEPRHFYEFFAGGGMAGLVPED